MADLLGERDVVPVACGLGETDVIVLDLMVALRMQRVRRALRC